MSHTAITTGAMRRFARGTLAGLIGATMLAGMPQTASAQDAQEPAATGQSVTDALQTGAQPAPTPTPQVPAEQGDIIRSITVVGNERLEASTILTYVTLRTGETYTAEKADQVLRDLNATELFSTYAVNNNGGNVVIEVTENPIINRIILEGNRRVDDDDIYPEIRLAPRQIFTRSRVRADVARIIELYKRKGRYAAVVEPQAVQLPQNRVDIVFEITEGPRSRVQQINIIGNENFSDGELRSEMYTKQARWFRVFSSNTTYDPDRLAADQSQLRRFYLTEGYADFRVVSAVAELTQDREDFIITYVVEEGERYRFGDVTVDSQIRDFNSEALTRLLPMQAGDWYDAKSVEDTVEGLTETAGNFGYAFADVQPQFTRNPETLTMDINFLIREAPRVYVERIDINGNTRTQDKIIRREFRVAEGDAFNALAIARTTNRINSLGYFQENFEVEQSPGSGPDRIVLAANVQDQPTGQLQFSAGFSSLERFILQASIRETNFRGRGQTIGASVNYSRFSRQASLSFFEPYVFDRNLSAGVDIYRRELSNFNFFNSERNTTYAQSTTGGQIRAGLALTEYLSAIGRYTLNFENVTLDENQFFADFDGDGITECEPLLAGRFLCDAIGERTSSIIGLTLQYDRLNNRVRPTSGFGASLGVDFAGLGGNVRYVRTRANARHFWPVGDGFIFSLSAEGGYIHGLEDRGDGVDPIRLPDRFFLGEPQFRGFDLRGVGPRVLRQPIIADADGNPQVITDRDRVTDDALGGNAYYLGRAELEIPLGTGARELGLRPSIFMDIGAVFGVTEPQLTNSPFDNPVFIARRNADGVPLYNDTKGTTATGDDEIVAIPEGDPVPDGVNALGRTIAPFQEVFVGDSASPRLTIGIGVNWNSPFGPFRIDLSHVLLREEGDDIKTFSINVGTQF